MKARKILAAAIIVLSSVPGGLLAQDRRDLRVADDVGRTVRQYSQYTIFDAVNGRVDGGIVTLDGKVTMPYKKADIERLVARVDGVRELKSSIEVLPVSNYDDELRSRVSRAIYGNPSFWRYAAMVDPPIHIIVENGRVTLTGVVSNDVDRALARSLASGVGALTVKNELRTDAEVRSY